MAQKKTVRLDRLREIPLFDGLSDAALRKVLQVADEVEAPAGLVLIEPDREGAGMFILEEGSVVVERGSKKLRLGPGEFFGEMALLTPHGHRSARVRTESEVRMLVVPRTEFGKLLKADPKIAIHMLGVIAQRLAEALK